MFVTSRAGKVIRDGTPRWQQSFSIMFLRRVSEKGSESSQRIKLKDVKFDNNYCC